MSTDSTASTVATATTSGATAGSLTGCVKWFDNGLNYGFITVLSEGEHKGADIFAHQSNIRTGRDCFRTLYTGECVQFDLAASNNEKHPFHAVNVHGFNGTLLHCENPNYRPRRGAGSGGSGFGSGPSANRGHGGFRSGRGAGSGGRRYQPSQSSAPTQDVQSNGISNLVEKPEATSIGKPVGTATSSGTTTSSGTATSSGTTTSSGTAATTIAEINDTAVGKRGRGRGRKVSA